MTTAQSSWTSSSPLKDSRFTGISFWYETSSSCSFLPGDAADGNPVSAWLDTSSRSVRNNAMAGQRTDSAQSAYNPIDGPTSGPKYLRNGINGLPSLRFANSPTHFEYLVVNPAFQSNTEDSNKNLTLFVVLRVVSGSTGFIIDRVCLNNGNPLFGFSLDSSRNVLFNARDDSGRNVGGDYYFNTGRSLNLNESYVLTLQRTFGISFSARLNGQTLPTTARDNSGSITLQPIKIGRHCNQADWDPGMVIDVSEMALLFDSVAPDDVLSIETYLGRKYSIFIENVACSPGTFFVLSSDLLSISACMSCSAGTYSSQQGIMPTADCQCLLFTSFIGCSIWTRVPLLTPILVGSSLVSRLFLTSLL